MSCDSHCMHLALDLCLRRTFAITGGDFCDVGVEMGVVAGAVAAAKEKRRRRMAERGLGRAIGEVSGAEILGYFLLPPQIDLLRLSCGIETIHSTDQATISN